jgi:hypothetical protein
MKKNVQQTQVEQILYLNAKGYATNTIFRDATLCEQYGITLSRASYYSYIKKDQERTSKLRARAKKKAEDEASTIEAMRQESIIQVRRSVSEALLDGITTLHEIATSTDKRVSPTCKVQAVAAMMTIYKEVIRPEQSEQLEGKKQREFSLSSLLPPPRQITRATLQSADGSGVEITSLPQATIIEQG